MPSPTRPVPSAPDVAAAGTLIGDPSRAAMLLALLAGPPLPAGELARRSGVSPQTASEHLAKLVAGGLVRVSASGRHRLFSLGGAEVARALESLALVAPRIPVPSPRGGFELRRLQRARTCYDHLAGALGVAVTEALVERRYLELLGTGYEATGEGIGWLSRLGIDCEAVRTGRRPFTRVCEDWSERRPHLAGALGAALATRCFELGWVERLEGTRAVSVTGAGRRALRRELGLQL